MQKAIAIDFDGCLCTNEYPNIGKPILHIIDEAKKQQAKGAGLILWTCREGELLEQAVAWCRNFCGINFDAVNDNIEATKTFFGGNSRKISCDYYIDDKGCTPDVFYKLLQ